MVEKYDINLWLNIYKAYYGNETYNTAEKKFGSRIYFKEWWKKFDNFTPFYAKLVDPSKDFSLLESLDHNYKYITEIYRKQIKKNPFYTFGEFIKLKERLGIISQIYKKEILKV